jgi:hypothetical protein
MDMMDEMWENEKEVAMDLDENAMKELQELEMQNQDYLGDFPPLPSAQESGDTHKFAKLSLNQQQQIQQLQQPIQRDTNQNQNDDATSMSSWSSAPNLEQFQQQQRISGPSDAPNTVTPQQSALWGAQYGQQQSYGRFPNPSPYPNRYRNIPPSFSAATHPSVARFPGAGDPRGMRYPRQEKVAVEKEKPSSK